MVLNFSLISHFLKNVKKGLSFLSIYPEQAFLNYILATANNCKLPATLASPQRESIKLYEKYEKLKYENRRDKA